MKLFLAVFLAASLTITFGQIIQPQTVTYHNKQHNDIIKKLPAEENKWDVQIGPKFRVNWTVDRVAGTVAFEITAETNGWIGFGITKSVKHLQSDLIMGGVDGEGVSYFKDRYSKIPTDEPVEDGDQNWELDDNGATEAGGITTLKFHRKFDTGDTKQDIKIKNKTILFVWALGSTDDINSFHGGARGTFPVNILKGPVDNAYESTASASSSTMEAETNATEPTITSTAEVTSPSTEEPLKTSTEKPLESSSSSTTVSRTESSESTPTVTVTTVSTTDGNTTQPSNTVESTTDAGKQINWNVLLTIIMALFASQLF